MSGFAVVVLIVASIAWYFLPLWLAISRKHEHVEAIFALNLLAGWTFVGWVVALVWALVSKPVPQRRRNPYMEDL